MCSPLDSAEFLQMMVQLTNAKKVVEVGVFTGFTALAFALALPDDGQVFALDVSKEYASVGQPFWQEAKVDVRLTIRLLIMSSCFRDCGLCVVLMSCFCGVDSLHWDGSLLALLFLLSFPTV